MLCLHHSTHVYANLTESVRVLASVDAAVLASCIQNSSSLARWDAYLSQYQKQNGVFCLLKSIYRIPPPSHAGTRTRSRMACFVY